jgi:hypothetical protein
MPTEHSADVKFEIGHVLFIDIVSYSKLLINEQSDAHWHLVARKCDFLPVRSAVGCVRRFADASSPSIDDQWIRLDRAGAEVSLSDQVKF